MNATHAPPTPVVVLDMSSLRFRFGPGRRAVSAFTATGEHLATVPVSPGDSPAEAAFAVLTAAQSSSRLLRAVAGSPDPVGFACVFYNPFTTHVTFHAPDGLVVLVPDGPWPLPARGLEGTVSVDADGGRQLVTAEGTAVAADLDSTALSRALAAYV